MKPTSLSPEFYKNLYNEIINNSENLDIEDGIDTLTATMELDFDGFFVTLDATFEVDFEDDSFDHAFGTEYAYHYELGILADIDIESIVHHDEDDNETDLTDLFDGEMFWDQFRTYEVKYTNGSVVKSGDTVLAKCNYTYEVVEFMYKNTMRNIYICKPAGKQQYKFPRAFTGMVPDTEENRKRLDIA